MRHRLASILFAALISGAATAQDNGMHLLENGNDAGPWEAVGRLDIGGKGFCTGALIEPQLVLTAAHCLFDKKSGERIDHEDVEFLAGWRNGRASAYRGVRRAVVHPDYDFSTEVSSERVRNDVALLELTQPIRNTTIFPFRTAEQPAMGDRVGVVSYAKNRSEAPSLQEVCSVLGAQEGVLVTSCNVDFGSSGAPIFTFDDGSARIVSVVSAKAEISGENVSLGTELGPRLEFLRTELTRGKGFFTDKPPSVSRITVGGVRNDTGAKFVRP